MSHERPAPLKRTNRYIEENSNEMKAIKERFALVSRGSYESIFLWLPTSNHSERLAEILPDNDQFEQLKNNFRELVTNPHFSSRKYFSTLFTEKHPTEGYFGNFLLQIKLVPLFLHSDNTQKEDLPTAGTINDLNTQIFKYFGDYNKQIKNDRKLVLIDHNPPLEQLDTSTSSESSTDTPSLNYKKPETMLCLLKIQIAERAVSRFTSASMDHMAKPIQTCISNIYNFLIDSHRLENQSLNTGFTQGETNLNTLLKNLDKELKSGARTITDIEADIQLIKAVKNIERSLNNFTDCSIFLDQYSPVYKNFDGTAVTQLSQAYLGNTPFLKPAIGCVVS